MSQKHVKSRHTAAKEPSKAVSALSSLNSRGNTLVIRLVLATVIFAVSLIISMPDFVGIILLVLAAAAAGYDIVMEAVSDVENGRYLATSVVVVVVSVIAFFIGFAIEGAAVVLLYQIGQLLLNYAKDHTEKAALELLAYQDEEVTAKVKAAVEDKNAASLNIHEVMLGSSGSVLKVAVFLALAYAIALPIFTNYSYIVSVPRALMIILIATPILLPLATSIGIDPIQFGIMIVLNCGIGLLTPPVGAVLFIGSAVAKRPMEKVVKATLPFYLCMFIALLLLTYVPDVSLAIPKLLGGYVSPITNPLGPVFIH